MYLTKWLLVAAAVFGVVLIVRFLIKFNRRKKRILKYVQHLATPKEYPIIGSGLRFFGKNTEGGILKISGRYRPFRNFSPDRKNWSEILKFRNFSYDHLDGLLKGKFEIIKCAIGSLNSVEMRNLTGNLESKARNKSRDKI